MENKEDIIKIKSISLKSKKHKTYLVETDYEADEEYIIDEDIIIKYGILKDREFKESEFKKILKDTKIQVLVSKALNYISYGMRSKHEVYAYLDTKNKDLEFTQNDLIEVVSRIKKLGYIDDLKYANGVLEYYKKTKGKNYIINKLKEKQVEDKIIEEVILKYSDAEEYEVACALLNKISTQYRKYPISKQKLLLTQKLYRDGFSSDIISSVINKTTLIDESDDSLIKDFNKLNKKYESLDSYNKKMKIISSLLRKGYEYSKIQKVINN